MKSAPVPPDDAERLAALRALEILDTLPEERFDRLTRLAARMLNVPIALVSLVDEDRQWFKSRWGLAASQTPRDISFCGHAIVDDAPFVVENAAEDPRFADNPLVTGDLNLRFYAGIPLRSLGGHRVGTLCAIAPVPREIDADALALLQDLAAIAEQELIHAEIAAARDAALEASRAKSEFLANMSHEIRTPLNAVIGLGDVLRLEPLNASQLDMVETIIGSGKALLTLINDILDLSKIEAGGLVLEATEFSPEALLREVQQLGTVLAQDKDLDVLVSVAGSCPSAVIGDPYRVRQIVLNLVSNAVKFTPAGEVMIIAKGTEDGVRIDVRDTGIGMTPETLGRVFSAFTQADSGTTRQYGGTGLGLSIARKLCMLMSGDIEASSELGVGSRFCVTLPLPPVPQAEAPTRPTKSFSEQVGRLLVVDDDPVNLSVMVKMLRLIGHEVDGVTSGAQCLEHCQTAAAYDLVLMDVHMPGLDGLETARRLVAQHPSLRVVALTASAFPEDRERCIAAGMRDFIAKPIQLDSLREAVTRNLATP